MTPLKRVLDILVLLLLLPILLPIGCVVAVLVLFIDGRPVFFGQERMRSANRPFNLWKFRTMTMDDADAGVSGGNKIARITKLGRILRRLHLDEIPQMINVFRGDISLVGPRPPLRQYVDTFPELYAEVLKSRPGLTGMASFFFGRHELWLLGQCDTAEETEHVYLNRCIPRKARIDLIYQKNWRVSLDVWLFWITAMRVLHLPVGRKPKVTYEEAHR